MNIVGLDDRRHRTEAALFHSYSVRRPLHRYIGRLVFLGHLDSYFFFGRIEKNGKKMRPPHTYIFKCGVLSTLLENQVFFLSLASAIEFSKSIPEYKVCPLPANPFAKELFHKICVRLTPCVGFCEHKNLLGYFKAHTDL